ncbi:hypothetical protein TH53_19400 [Pedobacter lusitanus]|uniref:Uncharacterized protein n=1 Tax=Pedobacter lusitanus TaxID=1503925 RepID=A0A0D0F211_9SPHI|nr:hypothetical protein [Pedobacter lusitanus]KIO75653.1 hypothetical protein TH53_19400 [Pedobacter lusitanus]
MKQSDLLALLGLPVTDPGLIFFFKERHLMLPQSVALMKPNSQTPVSIKNSAAVQDKEWGFAYYFRSELQNENFPVRQEGCNYIPYFSEIIFDGKLYQKRERKESADFWNVSPSPDSSIKSIEDHFGRFDRSRKYPNHRYSFSEQVEVIVTLITEQNRLSNYFAAIKEV